MNYDEAARINSGIQPMQGYINPKKKAERWALLDDGTVGLLLRCRIEDQQVLVGLPTQSLKNEYRLTVRTISFDEWDSGYKALQAQLQEVK